MRNGICSRAKRDSVHKLQTAKKTPMETPEGSMEDSFLIPEGFFLTKEENSISMKNFHAISLVNVGGGG